ncbi:MAG: polysaccharide biosynthesis/export family protein [Armatimonadetes bacterium]|nr:polysaccharide biosynthesis/export family protein [Armatimonadota bacterium]
MMSKRTLVCVLLALLASTLFAQEGTYRLQPEDVIRIQVYNEQDITAVLPIGRDGNVSAPFVGTIRAEGKTTAELEADLAEAYMERLGLRDPIVSVSIEQYRTIRASISGAVRITGTYTMRPGDTIITLFTQGGGELANNTSDLRRATLRRKGSRELIPIDLYAMLTRGDMSQNYEVRDGDELLVPTETKNRILVLGRVVAPGAYPYREPMTLMDAIALGRGQIEFRSKLSAVKVFRQLPGRPGQVIEIEADLVKYMNEGDYAQNILLQPGDFVWVPDSNNLNFGQVNSLANILFIFQRFGFRLGGLIPGR